MDINLPSATHLETEIRFRLRAASFVSVVAVGLFVCGCRQNPSAGGPSLPWQRAPATAANNNQQPGTAAPQVAADDSRPLGLLSNLMRREDEQSRLAEQQRRELEQLSEWQRRLQEDRRLAEEEKLRDLRERAEQNTQIAQRDTRQLEEFRRRAAELDANNRDLHTQLAQADQQNRILEDKAKLLQQQLKDTADQLASTMAAKQETEERFGQLRAASNRRPSGARITANSSLRRNLTALAIPGVNVRQDGDVVRIELPSDALFVSGSATLNPASVGLLQQVAEAISTHYSRQIIGVEAHTDSDPAAGGQWRSNHQLSAAQATAVFDQLVERHHLSSDQLFVLGHGANHPVTSNVTPAGKARNRRIEVVIYPETVNR